MRFSFILAENLVERDSEPADPNELWAADITYIRTWEGWLYLAVLIDLWSRRVVGWSIAAASTPATRTGRS